MATAKVKDAVEKAPPEGEEEEESEKYRRVLLDRYMKLSLLPRLGLTDDMLGTLFMGADVVIQLAKERPYAKLWTRQVFDTFPEDSSAEPLRLTDLSWERRCIQFASTLVVPLPDGLYDRLLRDASVRKSDEWRRCYDNWLDAFEDMSFLEKELQTKSFKRSPRASQPETFKECFPPTSCPKTCQYATDSSSSSTSLPGEEPR